MDYALAIRRNRDQLRAIVLALFALARMRVGGTLFTLPRSTVAAIMLVLRPAESAVRRLIVIAALGLKVKAGDVLLGVGIARLANLHPWGGMSASADRGGSYRAFHLFDPLKSFDPEAVWDTEPVYESGYSLTSNHGWQDATLDQTPIPATHIGHRINALMRALENIPAQARRLKRWELKRNQRLATCKPTRLSPMRPGFPPGWRQRKIHEIDDVLKECHGLANDQLNSS